jgi:hypothetical protein
MKLIAVLATALLAGHKVVDGQAQLQQHPLVVDILVAISLDITHQPTPSTLVIRNQLLLILTLLALRFRTVV